MAYTKPEVIRPKFLLYVRYNFRTQAESVSSRDVAAIEHLIRKGRKQVEMYEDPKVRDCWVSEDMREWDRRQPKRDDYS